MEGGGANNVQLESLQARPSGRVEGCECLRLGGSREENWLIHLVIWIDGSWRWKLENGGGWLEFCVEMKIRSTEQENSSVSLNKP